MAVLVCVAWSLTSPGAPPATSLCENSEQVIFSCRVKRGAKLVSLCGSRDLTKDRGYVQYRFGLPGRIELEFPKQRASTQRAFKYSHYFRAQFDMTEISFTSDGYEYAIFDDYSGEQKPARREQGIRIVAPNNGKEVTLSCQGSAKANYSNLGEIFEVQP